MISLLAACCALALASPAFGWTTPCGHSQYSDAGIDQGGRIVGGWPARNSEFPYQLSLRRASATSHFCGGVFFNTGFAFTAAHCTDGSSAGSMFAIFGESVRNQANPNRTTVNIQTIHQHVDYLDFTFENDITILRLASAQPTTDAQYPICQPTAASDTLAGTDLVVSGWGTEFSGGIVTQELRYVTVEALTAATCNTVDYPGQIYPGMVCAGGILQDSCQGDSGGPLAYKRSGTFEVIGLVSWGAGCADGQAGVYTDVYYFLSWISGIIGS